MEHDQKLDNLKLFVFSEVGSGNFLLPIIRSLKSEYLCIGSDNVIKYFSKSIKFCLKDELEIDFSKINLLVCGTSLENNLESKYLKIAMNHDIRTISIIDHWTNFDMRFKLNKDFLFPDYILVNDEYAYKNAKQSGLPENKLKIVGNPHLEALSKKKLKPINVINWKKLLKCGYKKVITFISEIYRDDIKKGIIPDQGFDEFLVIDDLIKLCDELNCFLLIKTHPTESLSKFKRYESNNVAINKYSDFDSIINNSDFIVGMGSMFLIEASLFRDDVISYRPNEKISFIGNEISLTKKVVSFENLRKSISKTSTIAFKKENLFEGSKDLIMEIINK